MKWGEKKAHSVAIGIFLIVLAFLLLTNMVWPGIFLALGCYKGIRSYLMERYYSFFWSVLIFLGLFIFYFFELDFEYFYLFPVIFITLGIYLLVRELRPFRHSFYDKNNEIQEEKEGE